MPRAYCPKCGAEVPVDDEGFCHVGHEVDLAAATGDADLASAARGLEAEFEEEHPDEPEPWVADVEDRPVSAGRPVPFGDEGPPGVGRDADEGMPPAAHPQATRPDESDAWQPPTAEPAGPGPQPPPEPVPPPEDAPEDGIVLREEDLDDDDFGLDELEAAVAELEVEERGSHSTSPDPAPPTAAVVEPPPSRDDTRDQPPPPAPPPPPSAPEPAPEPAQDDGSRGEPTDEAEDEPEREIDLANFTASGDRVGGSGKKRGLFGFGR